MDSPRDSASNAPIGDMFLSCGHGQPHFHGMFLFHSIAIIFAYRYHVSTLYAEFITPQHLLHGYPL